MGRLAWICAFLLMLCGACQAQQQAPIACDQTTTATVSAATTTVMVPVLSNQQILVCGYSISDVGSTANLEYGSDSGCASASALSVKALTGKPISRSKLAVLLPVGNSVCLISAASTTSASAELSYSIIGTPPPTIFYTSGPGDVVASATAWYGLRAYTQAYALSAGKLVKVSRASDTQTCDILAAPNGGLGNTANCSIAGNRQTAAAFCNGTTCSIATWYDQTLGGNCGGTCDLTQATVANQPVLSFNCLGTLPCATFATQGNTSAAAISTTTTATVAAVGNRTGNTGALNTLLGNTGGTTSAGWGAGANLAATFAGTAVTQAASDNAWHALGYTFAGANSVTTVDNVSSATGAAGAGSWTTTTLNIGQGNATNFAGKAAEVGIWSSNFSATQLTNMCHNQFAYWGTSTSC